MPKKITIGVLFVTLTFVAIFFVIFPQSGFSGSVVYGSKSLEGALGNDQVNNLVIACPTRNPHCASPDPPTPIPPTPIPPTPIPPTPIQPIQSTNDDERINRHATQTALAAPFQSNETQLVTQINFSSETPTSAQPTMSIETASSALTPDPESSQNPLNLTIIYITLVVLAVIALIVFLKILRR